MLCALYCTWATAGAEILDRVDLPLTAIDLSGIGL